MDFKKDFEKKLRIINRDLELEKDKSQIAILKLRQSAIIYSLKIMETNNYKSN